MLTASENTLKEEKHSTIKKLTLTKRGHEKVDHMSIIVGGAMSVYYIILYYILVYVNIRLLILISLMIKIEAANASY